MSGNTGKMTAAALAARGPRMELLRIGNSFVICNEDYPPLKGNTAIWNRSVYATSYTFSYLFRIAKAMMRPAL